ncbi:hypothetical protein [Pseudoalteromonas phenolica]|uniref:hypothetical protein n=1 Tax=Pseudoalteromonas phenolica TaxID=161398 RepID=UPI000FFEB74D|nr:hypothetical protein [Pseudoalteromonas phenolica]RXE99548.1 hypothetical protein D9981_10070 [Pseudoalteromonas phenolica O-BC30]
MKYKHNLLIIMILTFLSGCVAVKYDPSKPLDAEQGLVLARITKTGYASTAQFLTKNKNKILDNYSFVMRLEENFFLFPMSAGTHLFDEAIYMQGSALVKPDLECIGEFEIKAGMINYIGDLYFDISPANNYIIFSTHGSSYKVEDNFEDTKKNCRIKIPKYWR